MNTIGAFIIILCGHLPNEQISQCQAKYFQCTMEHVKGEWNERNILRAFKLCVRGMR